LCNELTFVGTAANIEVSIAESWIATIHKHTLCNAHHTWEYVYCSGHC